MGWTKGDNGKKGTKIKDKTLKAPAVQKKLN